MYRKSLLQAGAALLLCTAFIPSPSLAQIAPAPRAEVTADDAPETMQSFFQELTPGETEITIPGAQWLQLVFTGAALGEDGRLSITAGDETQGLNSTTIAQADGRSIIFNGETVTITLEGAEASATLGEVVIGLPSQPTFETESLQGVVAPDALQEFFGGQLRDYLVIDQQNLIPPPPDNFQESICGTDNRAASGDARVGRIMPIGCTGWLVEDGQVLTAGHCIDSRTQVLQFDVPASQADGTPVAPGAADQYMIDQGSIVFENTGIGNDWATLRIFANTQTGQTAHAAQGTAFRIVNDRDPANIRITGFGVDGPAPGFGNGPRDATNQTQQTDAGPRDSHTPSSPNNSIIRYAADSQGGNSGGPVIDNADQGVAVGIHTNAGCFAGGGANQGTSFRNQALWATVGPRVWDAAATNDPGWADSNGWADVSNYSTIQALDVGGILHLVARANAGIIVQRLNGTSWQRLVTNDPGWADGNGWADVTNYSTIQALDVGGVLHLVARANAGIIVQRLNGTAWQRLATNDPGWADNNGWADVSNYSTIQALDVGGQLHLVARANAGIIVQRWNGTSWQRLTNNNPGWADSNGWADVSNYSTIQALDVSGVLHLVARANRGIIVQRLNGTTWQRIVTNDPGWADSNGWADVSNYSTIQALDVGGQLHLVARANAGIIVQRLDGSNWQRLATNNPGWADSNGWADVTNYSTIQAFEHEGVLHLMARANAGIHLLRWTGTGWSRLARNNPSWADNLGWADVSNYSTIQTVSSGTDLYLMARANRGIITLRLRE